MQGTPAPQHAPPRRRLPLWLKVIYTAFVVALVPPYAIEHGWSNFLWFSNVAMLLTTLTLWLESRWLASMMAVGVLIPELIWNVDFFAQLFFGVEPTGLAGYMFDPRIPLVPRLLSLYHVPLPILLVWLVYRLGYEPAALWAQSVLAWAILLASWLLTDPASNVNGVYGLGAAPQDWMHPLLWLALVMLAYPLLFHVPAHAALKRLFAKRTSHRHALRRPLRRAA